MVTRFSLSASISSMPIDACHSSSLPNSRIQNPQPFSSSADNPHCALLFSHDVISQEEAIEVRQVASATISITTRARARCEGTRRPVTPGGVTRVRPVRLTQRAFTGSKVGKVIV
jgi:hypothetical protein